MLTVLGDEREQDDTGEAHAANEKEKKIRTKNKVNTRRENSERELDTVNVSKMSSKEGLAGRNK